MIYKKTGISPVSCFSKGGVKILDQPPCFILFVYQKTATYQSISVSLFLHEWFLRLDFSCDLNLFVWLGMRRAGFRASFLQGGANHYTFGTSLSLVSVFSRAAFILTWYMYNLYFLPGIKANKSFK
jgi:hypothetical protein